MLVPEHVSSRFLASYQALLGRVAGKRLRGVAGFSGARKRLFTEAECLRAAVSDDAELVAALRTAVFGKVMVARHLKSGTEMIDHRGGIHRVLGLTTPLREMAWPWSVIETVICRYRGFCICDGLIVELGIVIGPNMKRDILAQVRAHRAPAVEVTGLRGMRAKRKTDRS